MLHLNTEINYVFYYNFRFELLPYPLLVGVNAGHEKKWDGVLLEVPQVTGSGETIEELTEDLREKLRKERKA